MSLSPQDRSPRCRNVLPPRGRSYSKSPPYKRDRDNSPFYKRGRDESPSYKRGHAESPAYANGTRPALTTSSWFSTLHDLLLYALLLPLLLRAGNTEDFCQQVMGSRTKIFIILEYITGGELFDKIVIHGRMGEDEARGYFHQLINAVDFCHNRGVYHLDFKLENLLLDTYGNLKISDFGLSVLSHQVRDDGLLHTSCGTPNYVAPEKQKIGYDKAAAVAKKAHKEGTTLKVPSLFLDVLPHHHVGHLRMWVIGLNVK